MRSIRDQRGQATIDYVAIVAVVALLLVAAGASVGIGAPGIANAVLGQVRHALCIVTGDRCEAVQPRPCPVASRRDGHDLAVNVAVLSGGGDRYVLREKLSDGTVRLTVAKHTRAGLAAGLGLKGKLKFKDKELETVDEAVAGAEGLWGGGRVFMAGGDEQADEIVRAVRADERLPEPAQVFHEGGVRTFGRLGLGALIAGAGISLDSDAVIGVRRDRASGATTFYLNYGGSATALASVLMNGKGITGDTQVVVGLTLDKQGRQAELSLSGAMSEEDGETRPGRNGLKGSRKEFTATVDLGDSGVAAAWKAYRDHLTNTAAIALFAEQLRQRARLDVREYDTSTTSKVTGGGLGVVLRLAAETTDSVQLARLRSASTRPAGGVWERRLDCV